ncbi:hypothetical protein [Paracoccus sp. (in: a-proteobacteria)]|uniref:TA system antitoxin ParD family protein n=1 Tax=Paracoccus sp. TaxID=267 RepID=UPI0035B1136C
MAQSVKLSDHIMGLVRQEAELQGRSVAGQITHWLKIGRAIERSEDFDHTRITEALEGQRDTRNLSQKEFAVWTDAFSERMATPTAEERAFFAERRQLELGMGLDAGGNLIRGKGDAA